MHAPRLTFSRKIKEIFLYTFSFLFIFLIRRHTSHRQTDSSCNTKLHICTSLISLKVIASFGGLVLRVVNQVRFLTYTRALDLYANLTHTYTYTQNVHIHNENMCTRAHAGYTITFSLLTFFFFLRLPTSHRFWSEDIYRF